MVDVLVHTKKLADEIKIKSQAYLKKGEKKQMNNSYIILKLGFIRCIMYKKMKGCVISFETFRFKSNYLIIVRSIYLTGFLRNETRNRRVVPF